MRAHQCVMNTFRRRIDFISSHISSSSQHHTHTSSSASFIIINHHHTLHTHINTQHSSSYDDIINTHKSLTHKNSALSTPIIGSVSHSKISQRQYFPTRFCAHIFTPKHHLHHHYLHHHHQRHFWSGAANNVAKGIAAGALGSLGLFAAYAFKTVALAVVAGGLGCYALSKSVTRAASKPPVMAMGASALSAVLRTVIPLLTRYLQRSMQKPHTAFALAKQRLSSSLLVEQRIGRIIGFSEFPSTVQFIEVNGKSVAQLKFEVEGEHHRACVDAIVRMNDDDDEAEKFGNQIQSMKMNIRELGEVINIGADDDDNDDEDFIDVEAQNVKKT